MSRSKVIELEFKNLKPFQPRRFIPEDVDLTKVENVVALYKKILNRRIRSQTGLGKWLNDRSELEAAIDQQGTFLYIRMTCQTDDRERSEAYQNFIKTVTPTIKPLVHQLNKKYLAERSRFPLDIKRFEVHDRNLNTDVKIFVDKNIPLQTQEALLSQEYQAICGAMMVHFEGQDRTLPQMAKYLQEPDRNKREAAWREIAKRRLKDKERLDDLFDRMLIIRSQIATNARCANFCEYQFQAFHRFDYAPADCKKYHQSIEQWVVTMWRELLNHRAKMMKIKKLRPWDLDVDPQGALPLKPFEHTDDFIRKTFEIFNRLDQEFGVQFKDMMELGLLDLASRRGKAPGGYQNTFNEARKPFIFMNAVGVQRDVETILHEAGHAFHALATRGEDLFAYRSAPIEFCEVASMSMELLGNEFLEVFYPAAEARRARRDHLEGIIELFPWIATVDAFQHWIYTHPGHGPADRTEAWIALMGRFGGEVDWTGHETVRAHLWHRQLHIFLHPFYYVEYGIAQLGALQVWANASQDKAKALRAYQEGLALGGSRRLPELFAKAGCRFDFSAETLRPLTQLVRTELAKLA